VHPLDDPGLSCHSRVELHAVLRCKHQGTETVTEYDLTGAPMWSCDATHVASHLAIVFSARGDANRNATTADTDPFALGEANVDLVCPHVYDVGVARRMVSTGTNRLHGGNVVAMVPLMALNIPKNMDYLQATLAKV
jgi:hypothetical protein